jgi:DHA3 family macrolide efflux protein-like MFS transporter
MIFVAIHNLGMFPSMAANGERSGDAYRRWTGVCNIEKISAPKLLALGLLVSTVSSVGIGWSTNIPLTFLFQVLSGLFFPCIQIGINTIFLQNTEESFVGRVNGVMLPMFMGMMVVGMSIAGLLMNSLSLLSVYVIGGILFLAGGLLMVTVFKTGSITPSER